MSQVENAYQEVNIESPTKNLLAEPRPVPETNGRNGSVVTKGERLTDWLNGSALAVSLFCVLLLAMFFPVLWQGKTLAPLDIVSNFYEPWASIAQEGKTISVHNHFVSDAVDQFLNYSQIAAMSLKQDGYVGWSPLTFGGRPEYANTMGTYFDWTTQLHRLFGFWDAWHIGLLGQFAIAGIGMFVFLRTRPLAPPICLAGAIAYAGNSQFIIWMYYRSALGSFCWVPWLLWVLEDRINTVSFLVRAITLAAITALAFLGGNLQYDAFIVLVIACVLLGWYLGDKPARSVALKRTGIVLASLAFTGALTAMMFVPCVQGFFETVAVASNRATLGYKEGWLEPVLHPVISLLSAFPTALGSVRTLDLAKLLKGNYFGVVYFGFLPVIVAFFCLGRRKTSKAARLLMFCGLVLPLTPLRGLVYYRISLLFIVGGIWAFAEFWENLDAESARSWGTKALLIFLFTSIVWTAASVLVAANHAAIVSRLQGRLVTQLPRAHLGMFRAWMLQRAEMWVSEFPIWSGRQLLPWTLAGISLVLLRVRRTLSNAWVTYTLSIVLAVQVWMFAADWLTVSPRPSDGVLPSNPEITRLKQIAGNERVYVAPIRGGVPFFPPNTLAAVGVASLQGYESIWFESMWHKAGYAVDGEKLSRLGIRFAVVQKEAGDRPRGCWTPDASSEPAVGNASCWPVVYCGNSFNVFRNDQAAPRYFSPGGPAAWAGVGPIAETFNRRTLRVAPGTDAVRVTENWSKEWRYRSDGGDWRPAVRAEDMAILLPLGRSEKERVVELEFRPSGWARWVSFGAWLIVGATLLGAALARVFRGFLRGSEL